MQLPRALIWWKELVTKGFNDLMGLVKGTEWAQLGR